METQRVISSIESLYSNYQFFGPTARFFKLVEMCASCRPVSCYHFYNPSISLNLLKITHQTWPFILLRHSCTNDPAPQVVKARFQMISVVYLLFFRIVIYLLILAVSQIRHQNTLKIIAPLNLSPNVFFSSNIN